MLIKNMDAWDKREFTESLEYNTDLASVERTGSNKVSNFAEFMLDVFGGLYKVAPEMLPDGDVPPEAQWSKSVYNEISQLQEWKNLRERTKMNPVAAAVATEQFCHGIADALPKMDKKAQQCDGPGSGIDMPLVRRVAREACNEAADEADKMNNMMGAFGYGTGDGRPQYASPSAKKEAAARIINDHDLQKIAELAGRMRRIAAEKQKQKTKHGVDELTDIMVGDDLARLVPAEISKLAHPLLKQDFRKKYLEKQLIQYKLRGREKKGRGPLVVCIDESSSMQGYRDIWAKAVGMALLQIAQQQKRSYAMIHFDSRVTRIDRFSGKTPPAEVMDAVSYFTGGGTDYVGPLTDARNIIEKENTFKDADIIFISDGECEVGEEWLKEFLQSKKNLQFNIISVLIDCDGSDVCKKFSDKVACINPQEDGEALNAMFTI